MSTAVDRVLEQRKARIPLVERRGIVVLSFVLHAVLTALLVLWPSFFKEQPKKLEFIAVTVVPPRALGEIAPTSKSPADKPKEQPPKEDAKKAPPKDEPAPAPPTPAVKPDAKALAADPKTTKIPEKSTPPPAKDEPKKNPPAAASAAKEPGPDALPSAIPKRQGSPFGNPLGASTQQATLGVEDPNFTYGYYLDRIVGVISAKWTRPVVGPEVKQSLLFFRIQRDGTIIELKLVETSGSKIFDDAALLAVQASSPLPPLPKSYGKDSLGIHLLVK